VAVEVVVALVAVEVEAEVVDADVVPHRSPSPASGQSLPSWSTIDE